MIILAYKKLFVKKFRTFLLLLLLTILILIPVSIGGINNYLNKMIAANMADSLSGAAYLTAYKGTLAVLTNSIVQPPVLLPQEVISEMKEYPFSPRIRIGGILFSDNKYDFFIIYGIDPIKEAEVTPAKKIIAGHELRKGENKVTIDKIFAMENILEPGDDIILFITDREGYTLPYVFNIAGIYENPLIKMIGNKSIYTIFIPIDVLSSILHLNNNEYTDIAVSYNSMQYLRKISNKYDISYKNAAESVPFTKGIEEFLSFIRNITLIICTSILIIAVANILLITLHEDKKEIGTIIAIGAEPKFIMKMILIEYNILWFSSVIITFLLYILFVYSGILNFFVKQLSESFYTELDKGNFFNIVSLVNAPLFSLVVLQIVVYLSNIKLKTLNVIQILREDK